MLDASPPPADVALVVQELDDVVVGRDERPRPWSRARVLSGATSTRIVAAGSFLRTVTVTPGMTSSNDVGRAGDGDVVDEERGVRRVDRVVRRRVAGDAVVVGVGERHAAAAREPFVTVKALAAPLAVLVSASRYAVGPVRTTAAVHADAVGVVDGVGQALERDVAGDADRDAANRERAAARDHGRRRVRRRRRRRGDLRARELVDDDVVVAGDGVAPAETPTAAAIARGAGHRRDGRGVCRARRRPIGARERGSPSASNVVIWDLEGGLPVLQGGQRLAGLLP